MALVREKDGKRLHVKSALMGESLVSKDSSASWILHRRSACIPISRS